MLRFFIRFTKRTPTMTAARRGHLQLRMSLAIFSLLPRVIFDPLLCRAMKCFSGRYAQNTLEATCCYGETPSLEPSTDPMRFAAIWVSTPCQ